MSRRLSLVPIAPAALAAAALLTLSGCVTVHGENISRPPVTKAEAKEILGAFSKANDKANRQLDRKRNAQIETGPLGAIDQAGLKVQRAQKPDGNPGYKALAFSDSRFLIPKGRGWPHWFVADTANNRDENRWMLVFVQDAQGAPWKASYLSVLTEDEMPEFARDKDGHVKAVPGSAKASRLTVSPDALGETYASYLKAADAGDSGKFAAGPHSTQWLAERKKELRTPRYVTQYVDLAEPAFRSFALRTKDGGALAFFGTRHHVKQTVAEGRTFKISENVKPLLSGDVNRSVTLERVSEQAVLVPPLETPGDGIVFLNRIEGLVAAKGE